MNNKGILTTALCLSVMTLTMAQSITGKVVDTKGEPLAFANVVLLNRQDSAFVKGAVSGEDGSFSIDSICNGGIIKVTTEPRPSMETTLWEGEFAVTWGTPFEALKETFLSKVKVGTILRVYVDGKGQGTATTAWWNNILTGKGDPERGDIMVNGPAKWEFELTDLSIQLLTEQDGFLLVGDGYTVKKVTIE